MLLIEKQLELLSKLLNYHKHFCATWIQMYKKWFLFSDLKLPYSYILLIQLYLTRGHLVNMLGILMNTKIRSTTSNCPFLEAIWNCEKLSLTPCKNPEKTLLYFCYKLSMYLKLLRFHHLNFELILYLHNARSKDRRFVPDKW